MFRALQLFLRDKGASSTLRPASSVFAVNGFSSATTSSHQRLAGKVAVITGGASGIGKATAAEFVRNGARVIICTARNHAARVMVPRRRGSIICTASTAAVLGGVVAAPAYPVSKAAVVAGLVRATAGELARSGVRVNAISPHAVPTPLAMAAVAQWCPGRSDEEQRLILERDMNEMVGPTLEAQDIARAAMYLASDEAKYVNGQNLVVDGGFTVNKQLNLLPAAGR